MEIFLSWSKAWSHDLANAFRKWIPLVLQEASPFMSDADIDLGTIWNTKINSELQKSTVGIVFLTPENINSPWLNFEAGALTKAIDSNAKIIPISFGSEDLTVKISKSPLKQFQSLLNTKKKDFASLISNLNSSLTSPLSDDQLTTTFNLWWPQFSAELENIDKKYEDEIKKVKENSQEKNLSNSEALISDMSDKVDFLIRQQNGSIQNHIPSEVIRDLITSFEELEDFASTSELSEDDQLRLHKAIISIKKPIRYLSGHYSRRRRALNETI
ncbi:toll/interleukin-1 receptor domain-containing protein [Lactiplantibacillus plantarum]|uniref:toll/interleukin-1 receptor domain-containing protein n=1 Tax=Lactiplantibacillus plantarum TaxID=1590 RepID=UPI003D37004A